MAIQYLTIEDVYAIHEKMLEIGGGKAGIRDFNLLHSAIERCKATFAGQELYPTLWLKAAAFMHSLIKNHGFYDGNKRTGYFSTMRFLRLNNYNLIANHKEIVDFTLSIDIKNLPLEKIASWLKKHSQRAE